MQEYGFFHSTKNPQFNVLFMIQKIFLMKKIFPDEIFFLSFFKVENRKNLPYDQSIRSNRVVQAQLNPKQPNS